MSSTQQQRLKYFDATSTKIVVGFIRLVSVEIPNELINLCLLFYAIIEIFDEELCSQDVIVSNSKDDGHSKSEFTTINNNTKTRYTFGSFRIDPAIHSKSVIEWTFEYSANNDKSTFIKFDMGITEAIAIDEFANFKGCLFGETSHYKNYGWRAIYKQKKKYDLIRKRTNGSAFNSEVFSGARSIIKRGHDEVNIIKIILNMTQKSISLVINDQKLYALRHDDIKINDIFRMGWSLQRTGIRVSIFDFKVIDRY